MTVPEPTGSDLEELRARAREHSPLSGEQTSKVLNARFSEVPNRLASALRAWPLGEGKVLDVGCSYGHCLAHFGDGSMGIDNVQDHVDFCKAIGLNVVTGDADGTMDAVPDAHFDYLWVSDIVEHLDAPRLALRRLAPKLRPGGSLLLYLSALPSSGVVTAALRRRGIIPFEAATHYYQFTHASAAYLVRRAGYRVERVEVPALLRRGWPSPTWIARHAPTLIIEAVPDAAATSGVEAAEAKNKPG